MSGIRTARMLLATVCAVAVSTIYAAQPMLAHIGRDVGIATSEWGWVIAAGQVGYLIGLIGLVPLGDVIDRRRLIALHLVLCAAGTLVTASATGAAVLVAGLAATGLFAVVVQTAVAFAADLSAPAERGRSLGVVTSGVVVGILGARVVAGILTDLWGWRAVYLALAAMLVALAVAVLTRLPAEARMSRRTYGAVIGSLVRMFAVPFFVSRGVIAFFLFASFGTLWSGLALPLEAGPWHLDATQVGLFGIAGLAGALGAARAGWWADNGRASRVTGAALVVLALSWIAAGQATWSIWLVIIGVIFLDFAVQAVHVSNQSLLTEAFPERTSSAIGGYMVFYSLGSVLGATATTAVYAAAGWAGCAVLGASFALCGLLTWALSRPMAERPAKLDALPAT
ncbi:MFS transporter [Microbacterium sp. AG238]|uniref:MFS transporter n=1 Tax=Microbacterium sp. AG238 TaxID=2183994 RepID=UPI000FF59E43|nr:MFS transporter [Microbacterium sp. AG238]RKE64405.1 putative MFS family arabinose efflux permease [Microbacterium sp. AG238]